MNFEIVHIAGVRNSVFNSLRIFYVKYLNMLCNFTV
jgi:hypothetical protein